MRFGTRPVSSRALSRPLHILFVPAHRHVGLPRRAIAYAPAGRLIVRRRCGALAPVAWAGEGSVHVRRDASSCRTPDSGRGTVRFGSSERVVAVPGDEPQTGDSKNSAWQQAANAIERYHTQYNIEEPSGLGPEPTAGAFQHRHDRRQTAAQLLDALDRLRDPGAHKPSLTECICEMPGPAPEQPEHDASASWEP